MGILRKHHKAQYTNVWNDIINNSSMSWEALGMLTYLLSKPNNWYVSSKSLARERNAGIEKVRRILGELEEHGYLNQFRHRNEQGKYIWITELYEDPNANEYWKNLQSFAELELEDALAEGSEKPDTGNPTQVEPVQVNPDINIITDIVNTDLINTETTTNNKQAENSSNGVATEVPVVVVNAFLKMQIQPHKHKECWVGWKKNRGDYLSAKDLTDHYRYALDNKLGPGYLVEQFRNGYPAPLPKDEPAKQVVYA